MFMFCKELKITTTGEDIFAALQSYLMFKAVIFGRYFHEAQWTKSLNTEETEDKYDIR